MGLWVLKNWLSRAIPSYKKTLNFSLGKKKMSLLFLLLVLLLLLSLLLLLLLLLLWLLLVSLLWWCLLFFCKFPIGLGFPTRQVKTIAALPVGERMLELVWGFTPPSIV